MTAPIDRDEVGRLVREEQAQLIEVLPVDDYEDEHIPGAINIPLKTIDAETARQLDRQRPVIAFKSSRCKNEPVGLFGDTTRIAFTRSVAARSISKPEYPEEARVKVKQIKNAQARGRICLGGNPREKNVGEVVRNGNGSDRP